MYIYYHTIHIHISNLGSFLFVFNQTKFWNILCLRQIWVNYVIFDTFWKIEKTKPLMLKFIWLTSFFLTEGLVRDILTSCISGDDVTEAESIVLFSLMRLLQFFSFRWPRSLDGRRVLIDTSTLEKNTVQLNLTKRLRHFDSSFV